jgi:hypothetical protein
MRHMKIKNIAGKPAPANASIRVFRAPPDAVSTRHYRYRSLLWAVLLLAAVPVSLLAGWQLLRSADFLYPLWYEVIGIDHTIAEYGPMNHYREHFELTTKDERSRLFAAIVAAIHDGGRGLETLAYHDARGNPVAPLLRSPEITHLRDVARLVEWFYRLGLGAGLVWLLALAQLWRLCLPPPPLGRYFAVLGLAVAVLSLGVIAVGAKKVFYTAHTLIFPAGHQWFFYYEESLMTMLMKAPDLFAAIAAEWLLLSAVCYWLGIHLSLWNICRAAWTAGATPGGLRKNR